MWFAHLNTSFNTSIWSFDTCIIQLQYKSQENYRSRTYIVKEDESAEIPHCQDFTAFYIRERIKTFFGLDFVGVERLIGSSEDSKESNPLAHLADASFCCFMLFTSSWSFSIFACISSIITVKSCLSSLGREGDWSFDPSFTILLPPAEKLKILKSN